MYVYTCVVVLFYVLLLSSVRCFGRIRDCDTLLLESDLHSDNTHVKEKDLSDILSDSDVEKYKEKFKVLVSNTGPAVIGSELDFLAELHAETVDVDKKQFLYHWMNDADNSEKLEATNNYRSNISSYIFDSELILPNKYKMKVCVYKRHKEFFVIIGENHTMFELTATLNGKSHIYQNLTFNDTRPYIFSTNRVIQYSVNLTDKFYEAPTYWFHLLVDGQRVETKENVNFFDFIHNSTGMIQVEVQVVMESFDAQNKLQRTWSRSIYLEDEVQKVSVVSESEIVTGNPVKFNITFDGSDVSICWRIVDLNNNTALNKSCDGPLTSGWFLTPGVVLPPGQYIVDVVATNDVSSVSHQSGVSVVYNGGGSGASSPLVVPIVFSMLGVVVLLSGATYIVRLRKKKDVEVADFDFHPEIQSTGFRIFQTIRGSISDIFQRNEYIRSHRHAKYHQTLAKSYGSIEDSNEEL